MINYKWLDGQAAVDVLGPMVESQGWSGFSPATTRALIAEENGALVGFMVLQLIGFVGPLYVEPGMRDGKISNELVAQMYQFLQEINATNYLAICDNPVAAKFCRSKGMQEVKVPVYLA